MFTYEQSTGKLYDDNGMVVADGYSGNGAGLNNPALQDVENLGPIPAGRYTIGELQAEHAKLGVNVLPLYPDPDNTMFGRSDFYIHGDNPAADHSASEGCVVLPPAVREHIAASSDRRLLVVATAQPAVAPAEGSA